MHGDDAETPQQISKNKARANSVCPQYFLALARWNEHARVYVFLDVKTEVVLCIPFFSLSEESALLILVFVLSREGKIVSRDHFRGIP